WVCFLVALILSISSGVGRLPVQLAVVACAVAGFLLMGIGGWFGGGLVYWFGGAVKGGKLGLGRAPGSPGWRGRLRAWMAARPAPSASFLENISEFGFVLPKFHCVRRLGTER